MNRFRAVLFNRSAAGSLFFVFLASGCASGGAFREIRPGENIGVPRFVELREEPSVSTLHFPQGAYTLHGADRTGYYYRAPRPIIMHSFAGSVPREGGIFVGRERGKKLRGYVLGAGGLTKVGNFAKTRHEFRE